MDPITLILFIAIGGIMIGAGVHFIPVGGAPAAMATATGVGTGTAMLAAGAGLTGLITAASMMIPGQPMPSFFIVGVGGAIGAMIMMGITMLIANFIYIFGVGVVPAASKVPVDWITKRNQEIYKTHWYRRSRCTSHFIHKWSYRRTSWWFWWWTCLLCNLLCC